MSATSFNASNDAYESVLSQAFGDSVVLADLARKHRKMRKSCFEFLRATCFRWAEMWPALCPQIANQTWVPSVGDAHAGNFGLWRDARARLVWGINDFDEAALLPWPADLIRLAASVLVACEHSSASDVAASVTAGYESGLANPRPQVLERERLWLRDAFLPDDEDRAAFWTKLEGAKSADPRPATLAEPLLRAMDGATAIVVSRRSAGTGSLGRPRFAALGSWRGGPLAAEVKARLPSCFGGTDSAFAQDLAFAATRAPEPSLRYAPDYVIRRLAPDSRKLDFSDVKANLRGKLLRAMGAEIAAVHAGGAAGQLLAEFLRMPDAWLKDAARQVARWTQSEWEHYRASA